MLQARDFKNYDFMSVKLGFNSFGEAFYREAGYLKWLKIEDCEWSECPNLQGKLDSQATYFQAYFKTNFTNRYYSF